MARDLERFAEWLDRKDGDVPPDGFSDEVIAECFDPANLERLIRCDARAVFTGWCGDTMEICLLLDGEVIAQASFMTDGCGVTVACGSMLTKMAKGLSLDEARAIESSRLDDALGGLPADHAHCAELAIRTLRNAIANHRT